MYGLKVAGRVWSDVANKFMTALEVNGTKFKATISDPCVYTHRDKKGKLDCVVDLHVDDFRHCGKPKIVAFVKAALAKKWKVTSNNLVKRHLGVNYNWSADGKSVELDVKDKIKDVLSDYGMDDCRTVEVPCEARLTKPVKAITHREVQFMRGKRYQAGIGSLLWISRQARPDISWVTTHLSQFCSDPRPEHWNLFVRVLRYLNGTQDWVLRYTKSNTKGIMLTDSDWAPKESEKRKSTSGRVFLVAGGAVGWSSKKQDSVAQSSAEAELIALAGGAQEAMWLKRFLKELDMDDKKSDGCIEIQVDNNACKQIANNRMLSDRTKHIDIKYFAVRDYITNGDLKVTRVDTKDNTSDIFTKPLLKIKFAQFRKDMGVGPSLLS
jgi:hypothetical protein